MRRHWVYLRAVLRHKWFVFLACFRFGVPIWSAILHDWDKFLPDEWFAYARYFYDPVGNKIDRRDKTGYYDASQSNAPHFDRAWLLHQKRNKHHWQWWVLPYDDGRIRLLPMADLARREMLADWFGAGRAYNPDWTPLEPRKWYEKNKDKMQLHPETRAWVEAELARQERAYHLDMKRVTLGL